MPKAWAKNGFDIYIYIHRKHQIHAIHNFSMAKNQLLSNINRFRSDTDEKSITCK